MNTCSICGRPAWKSYPLEWRCQEHNLDWFYSEKWQQAEKEVEEELVQGRHETFDTMDEFLVGLDS